jgi:glycosyltransferase involved in cell wall biosynthesis
MTAKKVWAGAPLIVASNTAWFDRTDADELPVKSVRFGDPGILATLRLFWSARDWHAVVFNVAPRQLITFCLLTRLLGSRCEIVSVDLILHRPKSVADRISLALRRWLLGAVDLFIFYFRDTRELEELYRIPRERVKHVPFKVNSYEQILETPTADDGYLLACGRSNRDYALLTEAVRGLETNLVILAHLGEEGARHGTSFDPERLPTNVTVVRDDGSPSSWIDWIARCKALVVPVFPGVLSPSGISTYLVAMALGKCVVHTEGPATRGLIDQGQAIIVPAGDVQAMKAALRHLLNDAALRERIALAGQAYARRLGGEHRLARDIRAETIALVSGAAGG